MLTGRKYTTNTTTIKKKFNKKISKTARGRARGNGDISAVKFFFVISKTHTHSHTTL